MPLLVALGRLGRSAPAVGAGHRGTAPAGPYADPDRTRTAPGDPGHHFVLSRFPAPRCPPSPQHRTAVLPRRRSLPGCAEGGARPRRRSVRTAPEVPPPAGTGYRLPATPGRRHHVRHRVRRTRGRNPRLRARARGRPPRPRGTPPDRAGVPVVIDARALNHQLTMDLPGAAPLAADRIHELPLLPAATQRPQTEAGPQSEPRLLRHHGRAGRTRPWQRRRPRTSRTW